MIKAKWALLLQLILVLLSVTAIAAEQAGGIRGVVSDSDFDIPLPDAQVSIAETGAKTIASDQGNYVFNEVQPGSYTLVFSKDGYVRQVKSNVVVSSGKMTEADTSMAGDFTDMEEFVVQDVQMGAGTEQALLQLRMESPAMMDSVGSELMSRAGAGDAAAALRLVAGTTVQDGKYATVRGLPDRYVNSQMNGVRLPTADLDKRAVQLDQFPAAIIESIQVSKTFTPDQQGDASGGAVNIILKGIPDATTLNLSSQYSWNSMVTKAGDQFLTYHGGGLNYWGKDNGSRDIQTDNLGSNWDGAVGVTNGDSPTDYKWSVAGGGKHRFDNGIKLGAFGSFFYERSSSYFDNGVDDRYWVLQPGSPMTPNTGTPGQDPYQRGASFYTHLYDVTQSTQSVKWGGLGVMGIETENHSLNVLYMYTHDATDKTVLAEDTRGKKYYFPNYNPNNPTSSETSRDYRTNAPYLRLETLAYTERSTKTLQFTGRHKLPDPELMIENFITFNEPEIDWGAAYSSATMNEPDKRFFGSYWTAATTYTTQTYNPKTHKWTTTTQSDPAKYFPYKPAENFNMGNLQRVWKSINEDSDQYRANIKFPFEQWSGNDGYLKFGVFNDLTKRGYSQESFGNFGETGSGYAASWDQYWSENFPGENHAITSSDYDVDYRGRQEITAWYYMMDLPLNSYVNVIGGARLENTDLSIRNEPDRDQFGNVSATWLDYRSGTPITVVPGQVYPNGPDAQYKQNDMLPSIGFEVKPWKELILRGSYSETVARQTFKELSPIQQSDYLGADVFIGNPDLKMSALKNYDLRLDYTPYEGGFWSVSYFFKDVTNPIEYTQGAGNNFVYTYPINYPSGTLEGYEFEIRQKLKHIWDMLDGWSVGANATLITSKVNLPAEQAKSLADFGYPSPTRDMTNTPEHLYNLFTTYDIEKTGTQFALFYTIRGDTLITGAAAGGAGGQYIPDVYEKEYGTLNFSASQKLGEIWKLSFQAKNLLDPAIDTVYRSKYIGEDVTKTSYHRGMDFSICLSATF